MVRPGPGFPSVATEPRKLIPDANSIASEDKRLPSEIRTSNSFRQRRRFDWHALFRDLMFVELMNEAGN